ncbi:MAG: 2Fe-2S iron-sulfur cluster-binding protein, partial [Alphaproteobacteria bacterium]
MPSVKFISHEGQETTIEAAEGLSVMEVAVRNRVSGIEGDCGGACACSTCHVYVDEMWREKVGQAS